MRQGKTQQLCALENLRATYACCGNGSILCNKYCKISLSFELTKICGRAESMIEKLREHFVFDIDQDVDYEAWSKPETWTMSATGVSCPRTSSRGMTTSPEECRTVVQRMMELLSCLESEMGAMAGIEEFRLMVSMFAKAIEHGDNKVLDNVLRRILAKFHTALREIDRVINAKHDAAYYKEIFHDQRLHYEETICQDVNDAFLAWKDQHLEDDIEVEALREYVDEAMEDLFQANVFDGIKDSAGRKKKEVYRREVSFDECDCPKPARFHKAYACFREVFDYRDGKYVIDEVKAGRLVFKIRKEPDKVKAFFWFVQTLALVSADIVLALIDRMQREDIPKAHWIVFYCELVRRGWIEDNLAAFCKSMKALFDVNLDHRALSRNMKNLGDDINQWPEEDDRQRKKKAFGQDFRKLVEAYIEYKRNSILSDVQKLVPPKSHFDTTK